MPEVPSPRRRKSIRLKDFDYAGAGFYFVTICTADRQFILGRVVEADVELSPIGVLVDDAWCGLPSFYPQIDLDAYVVMPNHIHGVIVIRDMKPTPELPRPRRRALSEIVRGFKAMSARAINREKGKQTSFWQRGFYEHVIRDEADMDRIREYIDTNPIAWANDPENPERIERYRR